LILIVSVFIRNLAFWLTAVLIYC